VSDFGAAENGDRDRFFGERLQREIYSAWKPMGGATASGRSVS